jgi:hypothetical protein
VCDLGGKPPHSPLTELYMLSRQRHIKIRDLVILPTNQEI